MFDANPEREDDEPINERAVVIIKLTYSGMIEAEIYHDPGDEALVADQLRSIADDLCGEGETRH